MLCYNAPLQAPVAQLDRVLVSEAKGRGFDSRRAHQDISFIISSSDPLIAQQKSALNII